MAESFVAVIAAAGAGTRLGSATPKQYLDLGGTIVLQRSIDALLALREVPCAVVVLASDDVGFATLPAATDSRVQSVVGGASRAASVLSGVEAVRTAHGDDVWVLVHDAARPLVAAEDVRHLIASATDTDCGAILAVPVTDTLKRASAHSMITGTVARESLWSAQTPQMFRAGPLATALREALEQDAAAITDEASAMERAGHDCLLVHATHPNPKITHPGDLAVAAALLENHVTGASDAHR